MVLTPTTSSQLFEAPASGSAEPLSDIKKSDADKMSKIDLTSEAKQLLTQTNVEVNGVSGISAQSASVSNSTAVQSNVDISSAERKGSGVTGICTVLESRKISSLESTSKREDTGFANTEVIKEKEEEAVVSMSDCAENNEGSSGNTVIGFISLLSQKIVSDGLLLELESGVTQDCATAGKESSVCMDYPSTSSLGLKTTPEVSGDIDGRTIKIRGDGSAQGASVLCGSLYNKRRRFDALNEPSTVFKGMEVLGTESGTTGVNFFDQSLKTSVGSVLSRTDNEVFFKEKVSVSCRASTSKTSETDDEVIQRIVKDLVNYTVYEVGFFSFYFKRFISVS